MFFILVFPFFSYIKYLCVKTLFFRYKAFFKFKGFQYVPFFSSSLLKNEKDLNLLAIKYVVVDIPLTADDNCFQSLGLISLRIVFSSIL